MKIVVPHWQFLQYAEQVDSMEHTIEKWWNHSRIQTFYNQNGLKLERVQEQRWKITEEYYETEEFTDAKGHTNKRVVVAESAIVALGQEGKPGKKAGKLKEGKTFEEFDAASKKFLEIPIEINL